MAPGGAVHLDELEHDALTELANLGVSRAATNLRNLIGHQVLLTVPAVNLVTRDEAALIIASYGPDGLVAVHQAFAGDFSGQALLIFPEKNSLELVRAVTGGELPLGEIIQLEQEALAETGNIILNGCLATIANVLRRTLKVSLPEIVRGGASECLGLPALRDSSDAILFLYINFSVNEREINGYIAILMDVSSLLTLRHLLREFIRRTAGETLAVENVAGTS